MGLIAFCLNLIIPKLELYSKRNDNIDFTTSVDANGWQRLPISSNVILYMKKGELQGSWNGRSWRQNTASAKPVSLNTSNIFYGCAGGVATDHAINVCGFVDWSTAAVQIQSQNMYEDSVNTRISWWSYIVEFI